MTSSAADKTTTSDVSRLYAATSYDSVDSQFTEPDDDEVDDELRFFEACVECDDDALYDIIHDGVTWDEVNKRDKSGRVSTPHISLCRLLIVYPMHWIDPLISFFPSVCRSVCLSVSVNRWFSNDYVNNSLPIFTKFCMRLRNVVASTPIICETNRM